MTVLAFGAGGALADGDDHGWQGGWKSGPVGAWKFDKAFQDPAGTGPDLTPDASGNGNDG